jgi:CRISPR/Cas system-associated exonuclease Cas4 (RecB family)
LNTILIPAGQSLIDEIIPHLKATERDYSGNMVIFPGRRPSHFLRKALAREIKGSFIPPRILSMDEFVDSVYEGIESGRKLEIIDAVSILYDIHRKAKNPLGKDGFMTTDSFFQIGLKIYRDIEELCIEGISTHQVKDIQPFTEEVIPEQTLARLQSLSFFYEEFYKTVEKQGFSTRSLRYRRVAEAIGEVEAGKFYQIIFAGFFALTKIEKILFRRLLPLQNTLFMFQEGTGLKEKLLELDIRVVTKESESRKRQIHFYSSPDTHGQVYALSKVFEEIIKDQQALDEKTAVVLPSSETLFPLLRQGLLLIDEDSYNISLGYSLHRTPLFGFLNNLMELITSMDGDRVYVPHYLKFVLHPYTKNIYFNGSAKITRIMFHSLEEYLTNNRTKTFLSLREIEKDSRLISSIVTKFTGDGKNITEVEIGKHLKAIHRSTLEKFLSFEDVKDFATKCMELLTYIFNNSTAKLHPLFYPFSEAFTSALDVISRSLMKDVVFVDRSSYFTFFRKYMMTCHTPFEGTPIKGVQVLGVLETRNLKFDRVFILDANEDTLPDTRKEDTLLPFKARQILGLPTYMDRDKLIYYYFETLIQGAKDVHLFFVENDSKERSRFVERLLWERQKKARTVDDKRYVKSVQYKVRLKNSDPEEIMKTDSIVRYLRGFTYSASALDRYLKCPLQFYYAYVLRVDKKEKLSGDIERADIGKFVHKVISEYFSKRKGFRLTEKDISIPELDHLIDELFLEEYGENPTGAIYLLKRQIRNHLKDLIKKYYLPLIKEVPVTILDSEQAIRVSFDSFDLKGRLDSIEKRGEKTYIIDYKTGSNPNCLKINFEKLDPDNRESWNEAIGSLQLPVYLLLYSGQSGAKVKDLNGMFLLLGRSVISRDIELPLFADSESQAAYGVLKTIILRLLQEMVAQEVPFRPTHNRKGACPDCNFQVLCGTQWIMGWNKI